MTLNRNLLLQMVASLYLISTQGCYGCNATASPPPPRCSLAFAPMEAVSRLKRSPSFEPFEDFVISPASLDPGNCAGPWAELTVTLETPPFLSATDTTYTTEFSLTVDRVDGVVRFEKQDTTKLARNLLTLMDAIVQGEQVPTVRRFRETHNHLLARAVQLSENAPLCLKWASQSPPGSPSIQWCTIVEL